MKTHISIALFICLFALCVLAQSSGADVCKARACQTLDILVSECGYSLDHDAVTLTDTQAQCTCGSNNFSSILNECLDCMEPFNLVNYSRCMWNFLCPDAKTQASSGSGSSASSSSSSSSSSGGSAKTGSAQSGAYGRTLCIMGGLVVAVGIGFLG